MTVLDDRLAAQTAQDLVLDHLDLAAALARRYFGRGIDSEDLEQVARLALVKAAQRFDASRGAFAPFAAATITGELKRHFRDSAWMVRPPRRVQETQARLAAERLPAITTADVEAVAARLGLSAHDVHDAVVARGCFRPDSLDDPDHRPRGMGQEDEAYDRVLDRVAALRPLRGLDPAERQLLHWRFVDDLTQQAIADRLGISQMQVSRRLATLLATLRHDIGVAAA